MTGSGCSWFPLAGVVAFAGSPWGGVPGGTVLVVGEYPMHGADEIIELSGPYGPEQSQCHHDDENRRERDEQVEDVQWRQAEADARGAPGTGSDRRRRWRAMRRLLATTMMELSDMPTAAIHGASAPDAASGRATRL